MKLSLVTLLLAFAALTRPGLAFNVDVSSKVVHEGPTGSCDRDSCMFGFSVAQHREAGTPWLLVGAPSAESGQPGVTKGGAVYKCQPRRPGSCEQIPFDTKGVAYAPTGEQYETKSGQWFGSIVQSSGDDGVILACAPRYIYYVFMNRMDPVGMCFTARDNFSRFRAFRPCVELGSYVNSSFASGVTGYQKVIPLANRTDFFRIQPENEPHRTLHMVCDFSQWEGKDKGGGAQRDHCDVVETTRQGRNRLVGKWGYHRQGSCQAGLGAAISENGQQMFVGAPGSWYWQGQVFTQNLSEFRNQHKTGEGSPDDDDSYLGYSVTTGEFSGDDDRADVAVGMPRGAGLTGKVLIYNSNLTNLHNLTGTQIGAYFGYAVGSADLNGDGLDDLIIGAPMWTHYEVMDRFETGRVYIVYQDTNHKFHKFDTLDGESHRARFGHAVANAGNLNLDGRSRKNKRGIEDLIVGAPYDGLDNRGAVYIFLGSEEGIVKKPAQVIYAKDVSPSIRTFGWSLSAGMDLDRNEYPDLLIGAYDSGNAVYLRSAPVVHLSSTAEFLIASKQINLDRRECLLKDGVSRVPCTKVKVTMKYDGVGVPDTIKLEVQYLLDAKKDKTSRMFFLAQEGISNRNRTVTIRKGREWSDVFDVYLSKGNIQDKLTSLDLQVRYSLAQNTFPYGELRPVLGQFEKMATDSISIQKDCGPDNVCIPDMSLEASHAGAYVVGSGEKMELTATVRNSGEDAFNAMLYLYVPLGINFIKANYSNPSRSENVLCSPPSAMNNRTLQCNIGNPFPADSEETIRVFLQPTEENQDQYLQEYVFYMAVNSSNPEQAMGQQDNERQIRFPVKAEIDWRVTVKSNPSQVEYNITREIPDKYYFEDELGAEIFHVYDIKNKGASTIHEAEVYIVWPSFTQDSKEHLLYLLGVDYDRSKVTCNPINNINPLYVKTIGSHGYTAAQTGRSGSGGSFSSSSSSSGSSGYSYSSSSSSHSSSSSSGGGRYAAGAGAGQAGSGYASHGGNRGSGGGSYQYGSSSSSSSSYGGGGAAHGGEYYEESSSFSSSSASSSGGMGAGVAKSGTLSGSGGPVSGSGSGHKSEGSRYGSSTSYRGSYGSVAQGAEETRLGNEAARAEVSRESSFSSSSSSSSSGSSAPKSSYDYEKTYSSSSSSSSPGSLDTSSARGGGYAGGSGSSSSRGTVATSGWKLLENGTYIRIYDTQNTGRSSMYGGGGAYGSVSSSSSSSSGGAAGGESGESGSSDSGWAMQPDGTYTRQQSSWSSWSSSSSSGNNNEAGVRQGQTGDSDSSDSGWVMQPDGTYKRTQSSWSSWSGSSSSSGGSRGHPSQGGSGSSSYGFSDHFAGSFDSENRGRSESSLGEGQGGSHQDGNMNTIMEAARGPGNYHGTMRKSELESEAGGAVFSSSSSETRHQVENTRYQGQGGHFAGSYQGQGGQSSGGGSGGSSYPASSHNEVVDSSSSSNAPKGKWVWSEANNKWEWQEASFSLGSAPKVVDESYAESKSASSHHGYGRGRQGAHRTGDYFSSGHIQEGSSGGYSRGAGNEGGHHSSGGVDSGWILLDNGTYVRRQSSWSSHSESSYGGAQQLGEEDLEALHKQFQGQNEVGISGKHLEDGDSGANSTGWVRQPDGTMIKTSSSWTSWSMSSSSGGVDDTDLHRVRQDMEKEARRQLEAVHKSDEDREGGPLPPNVEPGFENHYRSRSKRAYDPLEDEIDSYCDGRCTKIKCRIGPLATDESVIFKIRSRLFEETQIKQFKNKVKISSKMITRITRLPYLQDASQIPYQTHQVPTEVYPSEMTEAPIPWWVWLLAALFGLLLLALIVFCLYKCGFFKRKRPMDANSPEKRPLNGY